VSAAAELAAQVRGRSPDVSVARDEVTVIVAADHVLPTLAWLRDELGFDLLMSVTATDWPSTEPRYWVAYELRSLEQRRRIRVKVGLPSEDPHLPSATSLFPGANFHERETFDFYGIVFDGHPDMTRILLPDDWEGYPLRKTEELGGVNTQYHGAFIPPVDRRSS
jgi:NADH-quinone oxidoreductase subunit C